MTPKLPINPLNPRVMKDIRIQVASHYETVTQTLPQLPLPPAVVSSEEFSVNFYQKILTEAQQDLRWIIFIDGDQALEQAIHLHHLIKKKNVQVRMFIFIRSSNYHRITALRTMPEWIDVVIAPVTCKDAADASLCFQAGRLHVDLKRVEEGQMTKPPISFIIVTNDKFSYALVESLRKQGRPTELITSEESLSFLIVSRMDCQLKKLGKELQTKILVPALLNQTEVTNYRQLIKIWYETHAVSQGPFTSRLSRFIMTE